MSDTPADRSGDAAGSASTADAPRSPSTTAGRTGSGPARCSSAAQLDRRVVVASAVVLIGALLLGVAVVALTYDPEPTATTTTAVGDAGAAAALFDDALDD